AGGPAVRLWVVEAVAIRLLHAVEGHCAAAPARAGECVGAVGGGHWRDGAVRASGEGQNPAMISLSPGRLLVSPRAEADINYVAGAGGCIGIFDLKQRGPLHLILLDEGDVPVYVDIVGIIPAVRVYQWRARRALAHDVVRRPVIQACRQVDFVKVPLAVRRDDVVLAPTGQEHHGGGAGGGASGGAEVDHGGRDDARKRTAV